MGKIKNRDAKKAANKVFSSGGGGGTKAEAAAFLASKQEKELKCPHCDRIFKQPGRLADHIQKRHGSAGDAAVASDGKAPGTTSTSTTRIMDIGCKVRVEARSSTHPKGKRARQHARVRRRLSGAPGS